VTEEGPPNYASTALVVVPAGIPRPPGDEVGLQSLWLSLQRRSWQSLAIVAAAKGVPTLETANSLARISWSFTGQPATVFDLQDLSLRLLEHQTRDMAEQLRGGERIFVALRSPGENPTASPIAQAADAVVLCLELGKTDIKTARQTVAAIGKEKFIGTILVKSSPGSVPPPPPPPP
jgi:hypothetical protein